MHQSETAAERQIQPRSVGLCSHLFTLFVQLFQPNSAVILGNAEPCRPSAKEPGRKENKDCIIFRKQGNCECIATWGRPSHALSRFNHDAKLEVAEPVPCSIIAFCCWYITLRCDLDLWPRDLNLRPSILNICGVSPVTWCNSVPNLNAIEQSAAELLWFQCLTLWP